MQDLLKKITLIKENLEEKIRLEKKLKQYRMLEKKIGMTLQEFVNLHFVEEIKCNGENVEQEKIEEIKTYFRITNHALQRLDQRTNIVVHFENGMIDYKQTFRNIKYRINHRLLAYYNTDGTINIAIDNYNYFVFAKKEDGYWLLITFKEKSYNDNDIFYKQELAMKGINR